MNLLFRFILLVLCFYFSNADCRPGEYKYNSRCFRFVNSPRTFDDSENYCKSLGYHLVSIHDAFENAYLQNISKHEFELSDSYFRIGLNTSDDIIWQWTDSTIYNYWVWSPGEPPIGGGRCAAMIIADGKWRAYPCSTTLNFVCAGNASGPVTSGTTGTRTSNTGSTQASTSPTSTPTPTTTCPCNGRAFYGELAVVFELRDSALDITRNIENYIERSLLNYTGNPYILNWDCDIPATMLVLLPYPRTLDYPLFSTNFTFYGMIFDMDKVVTLIEDDFNPSHPDITSITVQDGLEYQYNFCRDQEIDYIPPKFTILIANGNDDPNSAKQIADEMKRNNFTIVTLAFMTDKSKIAGLASDPSYEFQLDSTDQFDAVSNKIGKTLFDLSNRCISSATL